MKILFVLGVLSVCSFLQAQTLNQPLAINAASPTSCFIGERGPNSQTWDKIVQTTNAQGNVVYQTNQAYVELATGLNYEDPVSGKLLPSREEIDAYPDGAIAQYGQHKVIFANNLNTFGAIDLQTPDGKELRSDILGLSYYDTTSGKSVLIAQVQDSQGQIVSSNQVVYPNTFQGVSANVRYCYTRAGLEQDVILLTQLPTPESFGLSSTSCVLQVLTEFTAAPAPLIQASPSVPNDVLADEMLDFGAMKMVRGRAFLLGTNSPAVLISKQWLNVSGRTVLVESMPLASITKSLSELPAFSATSLNRHPGSVQYLVSNQRLLPPPRTAATMKTEMKLALSGTTARGFDLDLIFVNSSSNPYTFAGDNTYWVTGPVNFSSGVTFEGGSVIKYSANASLNINDPGQIICEGTAYRPTVFTSKDDNSVGTAIGSGTPNGFYANPAIAFNGSYSAASSMTLHHFRISYALQAIYASGLSVNAVVQDGQIVKCYTGFNTPGQTGASFGNVLFANVSYPFDLGIASVQAYNSTFCHLSTDLSPLAVGQAGVGGSAFLTLENCILANIYAYSTNMPNLVTGDHNGFYNSGVGSQSQYGGTNFGTSPIPANGPPFHQSVGSGSYYLASGCGFFNEGTANIDPVLLADLKTRTTYPPQVLTSDFTGNTTLAPNPNVVRDSSSSPDLGYHYDPLDYCLSGLSAGTTLTLTNGVVIGIYGSSGLSVGGTLISQGTPNNHNQIVYYSLVQEGPEPWGANSIGELFSSLNQMQLRFTDLCLAAGQKWLFCPSMISSICLRDCNLQTAFFNMSGTFWGGTEGFTNNVFNRCQLSFADPAGAYSLNFYNNLFLGGSAGFNLYNSLYFTPFAVRWNLYDNLFDSMTLSASGAYSPNHSYNGYYNTAVLPFFTNNQNHGLPAPTGNVWPSQLDFQAGPLGVYYYPTNGGNLSQLIYEGSTNANLLGLCYYTVTTNEVAESTNLVSIGYHYVATDFSGNPLATFNDGIPDYLDDQDGDGLPDNWEMEYFGRLGVGADTLDGNGNTLLSDYLAGSNPSAISFTVRLGNQHFNASAATGNYLVLGGIPSYEAVLVNDDNLDDASWRPYDGIVHLNLGPTDGVYQVWLGLKGFATNSQPAWFETTVYLNRVAPQLFLTSPTNNITATPILQVEGWSPAELSGVSFDLSNAVVVLTNQNGVLTSSWLDINTGIYTTNSFQCFDIPLTNGMNTLTLYATDLAGNETTTNLKITLDYSTATNPVVNLVWPTNGMEICQSSFTLRGWTDDSSAQVTAQIVDGSGTTNTIYGMVERNGKLWAENIPLAPGANALTLTVINAAGISSTTNFMLVQSDMTLTLDSINGDLWLPTVNVNGSISDATAAIWVNGMLGTNYGNGTWSATNVPVTPGGVASFDMNAIPGGGNDPYASVNQDKTTGIVMDSASGNYDDWADALTLHFSGNWNWSRGSGGYKHRRFEPGTDWNKFDDTIAPDLTILNTHITGSDGTDTNIANNGTEAFDKTIGSWNSVTYIPEPNGTFLLWSKGSGSERVKMVLLTGGKSKFQHLYRLTTSATDEATGQNIPSQEITIAGQSLDANGVTYKIFQDGDTPDVTPQTGVPMYSFAGPDASCIPTNENLTAQNSITLNAYFLVEDVGYRLFTHSLTESYTKAHNCDEPRETWHLTDSLASLVDLHGDDTVDWGEEHKYSFQSNSTAMGPLTHPIIGPPDIDYLELPEDIWILPITGLQGIGEASVAWINDDGGGTPGVIIYGGTVNVPIQ